MSDSKMTYCFSLLLTGILVAPILHHWALKALLVCALIFMAAVFILKHRATVRPDAMQVLLEGLVEYPAVLVRSWWTVRVRLLRVLAIFMVVLGIEWCLAPILGGTVWLEPFPWWWALWGSFGVITAFRVAVLVAHWLRAAQVRDVLMCSPIRHQLGRISVHVLIAQAFITGLLSHLCLMAPSALFLSNSHPSWLREALLTAAAGTVFLAGRFLRRENELVRYYRLFYQNHRTAHDSRFMFTVLHGPHHDAIPSALIGSAGGTGFLENGDRAITWLDMLDSVTITQFNWARNIVVDMLFHQYIPGVFPFSKGVVKGGVHHVAHHFGSLRPLGIVTHGYWEVSDFRDGYRTDNRRIRWFLDVFEHFERLGGQERERFFAVGGKLRRRMAAARDPGIPSERGYEVVDEP
jgi:hypothetical protein